MFAWLHDKKINSLQSFAKKTLGTAPIIIPIILAQTLILIWSRHLPEQITSNKWITYAFFITLTLLVASFLAAFVVAVINPQTTKERNEKDRHQKLFEQLNSIIRELNQANLITASLNFKLQKNSTENRTPSPEPIDIDNWLIGEQWLRQLDADLKIKESVVSIEKVIQARQRTIDEVIQNHEKNKTRIRRAALSSTGGLATGFVTYEIGNAVKNYILINKHQDPISLSYWLAAVVQHESNSDLNIKTILNDHGCKVMQSIGFKGSESIAPTDKLPNKHNQVNVANTSNNTTGNTAKDGKTTVASCLNDHLMSNFHQPEIMGQSIVLTITVIMSFFAAFIGWRRTATED